ncbi:MAG: chemotaxis-specific protein-glutamate methyltransferase CheB [bacterium]|nr:chemotaxis-specific protein-glutamate methyltransferase CheB [bacterium]
MSRTIRVLLVEDSLTDLTVLKRMIATSSEIEVVGTASNGREALALIPVLDPHVICTDLQMPEMDGLELTREVMHRFPRPILVISSLVDSSEAWQSFRLLGAGAIDVFPKYRDGLGDPKIAKSLVDKIRVLSGVFVFTKKPIQDLSQKVTGPAKCPAKGAQGSRGVVVIGTSTGGPQALHRILTSLPESFPMPILCVQHISEGFIRGLVDWLKKPCRLSVKIMEEGEIAKAGTVYFPMEETHLCIDSTYKLLASREGPIGGHRPSIDVLFQSAADAFGSAAVGVLLTGMGRDGAMGLKSIFDRGGVTLAQDKETSVVYGMPHAASELGAVSLMLPLDQVGPSLINLNKA